MATSQPTKNKQKKHVNMVGFVFFNKYVYMYVLFIL